MSAIDDMLAQMVSASARLGGGLWLMEERSMLAYMTRPRSASTVARVAQGGSFVSDQGATAVIQVHGVMMKDPEYDDETSTTDIEAAVRLVTDNSQFENVVFDIDSPGGSTAGIASLADAVDELTAKKNTVAQSTGMIASGSYWLAACCRQIFAERMDWIGSIGVRMDVFDASRWFANAGLERVSIDTGPLKSTGLFGTEVTEDQRNYLKSLVADTHRQFTDVVTKGRKLTSSQFASVATGGVFPAADALRLKLIDGIQTMDKTLAAMPRRKTNPTSPRSKVMDPVEKIEPVAATAAQLKAEFPDSSSDFRMEQLEKNATIEQAHKAYSTFLAAENAKLKAAKEDADQKTAAAEAKAAQPNTPAKPAQVRGNKPPKASDDAKPDAEGGVDYYQLAADYKEKKKCRWSEACLEIKRRYPEARAAMGAPPANDSK